MSGGEIKASFFSSCKAAFKNLRATRGFFTLDPLNNLNLLLVVTSKVVQCQCEQALTWRALNLTNTLNQHFSLFQKSQTLNLITILQEFHRVLIQLKTFVFKLKPGIIPYQGLTQFSICFVSTLLSLSILYLNCSIALVSVIVASL